MGLSREIVIRAGVAATSVGNMGLLAGCVNESAAATAPSITSAQELAAQADHSNLINYLNNPSHRFGQTEDTYEAIVYTNRVPSGPIFVLTEEGRTIHSVPFFSAETELPQQRLDIGFSPGSLTRDAFLVETLQTLPDGSQINARWAGKYDSKGKTALFVLLETEKEGNVVKHVAFVEIPTPIPVEESTTMLPDGAIDYGNGVIGPSLSEQETSSIK